MIPDPLATPTRVAFAGDWHMNRPWAEKAIRHASDQAADVIVQLGDYGYTLDARFVAGVEKALAAADLSLLWVDGNHEDFNKLHGYPVSANGLRQISRHVWHIPRGFRWEWDGIRFLGLGGAHSVDRPWRVPQVSWWPQETITPQQATRTIERRPADVLVAHDCPAGVTIPGIDDRHGPAPWPPVELARAQEHRDLLRRVADAVQPSQIWHGHYHRAYTTEANLGYGPVKVTGLDCDETTLAGNVRVVDLDELRPERAR